MLFFTFIDELMRWSRARRGSCKRETPGQVRLFPLPLPCPYGARCAPEVCFYPFSISARWLEADQWLLLPARRSQVLVQSGATVGECIRDAV